VLIFIITILLLATDFYYLKNIAGRRLVGLRWWNEVDTASGDSRWVFESFEEGSRVINATDKRFFWIALYAQPVLWVLLAVVALASLEFIWLTLVGEFLCVFFWVVEFGLWDLGERKDRRRRKVANKICSHRSRPYDYEYPRLLALRQVQPSLGLCVDRCVRVGSCAESGWWHGEQSVQQGKMISRVDECREGE
jgi:hypothetical protein